MRVNLLTIARLKPTAGRIKDALPLSRFVRHALALRLFC